ncbi:MAG TPA: CoA activase, partial [Desulfobacteraceae bacterium]|nr:CoA activase [Desulfobacteraceae bacterium]
MSKSHRKADGDHYYIGIDIGSVSLNGVVINQEREIVYEAPYHRHIGKIEEAVLNFIREQYEALGKDRIRAVAFTGNHGQQISARTGGFYEFETISQVIGSLFIKPDTRAIICMGGQDTALFQISHNRDGWELEYFNTNGPCASGTGSFIDQQAERLATSIYDNKIDASQEHIDKILSDFIQLGTRSKNPSNVACRCTVFTKSDMIHLQNKGERLED